LYGFRDNPTLDKPTFSIKPNEIAVLTGRDETAQNGIFDLLMKLNRQHEGNITLDGIEIEDIDDCSYYKLVSSVSRQSLFFNISIMKNLKLINDDEDKIKEVCTRLGLDEEIIKLDNGYETVIDSNTPISMSATKLLVIARLLLTESKIILIDDIINLLEEEHERNVLALLEEMKRNHTIIIITHSKEIIEVADEVFDVHDKIVTQIK
jgi:ABC-type multidrug transport system fused ATPase/permease subunit